MASNYTFPGGTNSYVPQLHKDLLVSYIRNPAKFPINRYVDVRMVDKQIGYYAQFQNSAQARITSQNTFVWPDGNDAPVGQGNDPFKFLTFNAEQYGYNTAIGYLSVEQSSWDMLDKLAAERTMLGMTARSQRVGNTLSNFANYPANAQITASGTGGATWANASSSVPAIRKTIMTAANIIQKATLGVVSLNQLYVVMNPNQALIMSTSNEWIDFVKQSPNALAIWQGQEQFNMYNVPNNVFGLNVVVDDTVYTASLPGDSVVPTYSYTFPDNTVAVVTKQQAIEGYSVPSFSSFELFCYKNFETYVYNDVKNRRYDIQVIENCDDSFLYAPQSACLIYPNS